MKLIQKIKNNKGSISLLRISDTHFEVCRHDGTLHFTKVFNTLIEAIEEFNILCGE